MSDALKALFANDLSGFDFDSQNISGLSFAGKSLSGACFDDVIAINTNFQNCDLYWARFFRANVQSADFRNSILRGANLAFADFSCADLRGADLGRDSLNGLTRIEGTNFSGAKYDSHTILPEGLKPESQGMIYCEN
jgi:uncharacterized protein YjbI with pentapeptide repeats